MFSRLAASGVEFSLRKNGDALLSDPTSNCDFCLPRFFHSSLGAFLSFFRFGESILGIVHADEELASGAFQCHDEFRVVGVAVGGVF